MPRVEFYVLSGTDESERMRYGCRLIEQAYLAGSRVFVWSDDPQGLERFDELLWTFADRSFVPHESGADPSCWSETPVLLGSEIPEGKPFDLLVNLGQMAPPTTAAAQRIVELVDADEERRRAGRNRFRQYRDRGLAPETHNVRDDAVP